MRTCTCLSGGSAVASAEGGVRAHAAFAGRSVAVVASTGPSHGRADVYVDGAFAQTVDARRTELRRRVVAFQRHWGGAGEHRVTVVPRTAGFVLDALVVAQQGSACGRSSRWRARPPGPGPRAYSTRGTKSMGVLDPRDQVRGVLDPRDHVSVAERRARRSAGSHVLAGECRAVGGAGSWVRVVAPSARATTLQVVRAAPGPGRPAGVARHGVVGGLRVWPRAATSAAPPPRAPRPARRSRLSGHQRRSSCSAVGVDLLPFLAVCVLVVAVPGVDMALVTQQVLVRGRRAGLLAVAGIVTGSAVQAAAATLGLSALLATSSPA